MQRLICFNRIILAFTVAVILAGGATQAWATAGTAISYSGLPGSALGSSFDAYGNITTFSIAVDFNNLGHFVYASDLLIGIVAPNGNRVEFGGAGETLGFPSAGTFPGSWDTDNNGHYTHGPVNLSAYGLGGDGTYFVYTANGWGPSPGASWSGAISFQGINASVDSDGDGVYDHLDNCPDTANADQADADGDGPGDVCDRCQGFDDSADSDGDGVADGCDLCTGAGSCGISLGADWDSADSGTITGSLCGSRITVAPFSTDPGTGNFSGSDYTAAPLSASQERLGYGASAEWTATFDPPVTDLLLYTYFWRAAGSAGGPDPTTYTFDQPFVIVSGLAGAWVTADQQTLTAQSGAFHSGIVRFPGPVSSLSLATSATDSGAGQGVTFSVNVDDVDSDGDGSLDACDLCPGFDDTQDADTDGVADGCDACPNDAADDSDGDGVCDSVDQCPGFDDGLDADTDGIPDGCDTCPDSPNVHNVTEDAYYPTIQAAIDASAPGDVIELGACTFFERGTILDNKDITIRGQGPDATIIDGESVAGSLLMFSNGDDSLVESLTLRNGVAHQGNGGGAVYIRTGSDAAIRNCRIENNAAGGYSFGAAYVSTSSAVFQDCVFRNNSGSLGRAVGIAGGDALCVNCLFDGGGSGNAMVYFIGTSRDSIGSIVNCTFTSPGTAVYAWGGSGGESAFVNVANSVVLGNLQTGARGTINKTRNLYAGATGDNIDGMPTFVDAANGDYRLAAGSLGIDAADYNAYVTAGGSTEDLGGLSRTHDDTGTADTGVGALTYLDMGAFEFQGSSFCGGDSDGDGDVDLDDYASMNACMAGPNGVLNSGCACFDFDVDGDVDMLDYADFQTIFTGN